MSTQLIVNQLTSLPFTSTLLVTGMTSFANVRTLVDGVLQSNPSYTYTEIGNGLYTLNFTPNVTGKWTIFIEGRIQGDFEVVTKDTLTILRNLEDESLGSWTWDKTTGVLTLLRQDTTTLATFQVVDDLSTASRERVS